MSFTKLLIHKTVASENKHWYAQSIQYLYLGTLVTVTMRFSIYIANKKGLCSLNHVSIVGPTLYVVAFTEGCSSIA